MENPENQCEEATGAVEDPPPPTASTQEQSTSESSSQPQQQQERRHAPPLSPLTGSYLLIVVGEPHSERHKEIILQKIAKAFLSWDVNECHVSLEKELQVITGQSPEGEEARYGERLIQYATENLVTEILIHPQLNTLHQCLKNLLSSFTKHRHIIHAGYTFAGNGSWILQDGTLSISDLVEALHEPDVLRVLKAYENSVSIDVHCAPEGDWTTERFQKEPVSKLCNIRINPGDVMTARNPAVSAFIDYLSPFLEPANIQQLLQPTDVVGNIRFTHPTLYVFPGGQGDAALFGINGFNMLIDGGFARKACFWDFARHLDRLDAVLLTRLNNSTVNGISAVLQRKKMNHVYPQIGHFFCNLQDRKIALSPDGDKDKDSLIVNLAEEGQEIVANLRHLALKPHPCYRDGNQVDPVNLYHKVGHGKLDMYVISPARDSQAVKEFLAKWSSNDGHLFSNTGKKIPGKSFEFPLQNLVSICALLVWQPANPSDTITRILFPGSTPQHKIFEGLEKLRHLEFLKHPVCSAKSISPSVSTTTVTRSLSKTRQAKPADNKQKDTKIISKPQIKPTKPKTEKIIPKESKPKLDNKLADEKNELENVQEPLKKLDNRILSKDEQIENIKKEIQKIEQAESEEQKKKIVHRSKYDMRNVKSKVDSRAPSKSIDRKKAPEKKPENELSPPSTPKKTLTNGTATKTEKARIGARPTKGPSPTSTPAKSTKEANNRKVVEARVTTRSTSKPVIKKKEETTLPLSSTVAKTERKPISRRPKAPLSPVKLSTGKQSKGETESVPKEVKKKTEVDTTVLKVISQTISKDLKQGAETEKTEIGEKGEEKIEIKTLKEETTENKETDIKAVKNELESAQTKEGNKKEQEEEEEEDEDEVEDEEEEEEYLIVTKEEYGEESAKEEESGKENEEEEVQTKDETEGEGEMKKLLREEEESEKKRESYDKNDLQEGRNNEKEKEKKPDGTDINQTEIKEKLATEVDKEGEKVKVVEERGVERLEDKAQEKEEVEPQKVMEADEGTDFKEPVSKEHKEGESLPEEKISNTVETSATTAPTLPEDERIEEPAEEEKNQHEDIKEVIEEKYIQEKTKEEKQEEAVVESEQPYVPSTINVEGSPVPIQPTQRKHPRDVVKTPDEVAELPMHEEVDPSMYSSGDFTKEVQRKPEEEKLEKPDFKAMIKGEANFLDEEDGSESEDSKKPPGEPEKAHEKEKNQIEDPVVTKYLNIIDELEKSSKEPKQHDSGEKPEEKQSRIFQEEPIPESDDIQFHRMPSTAKDQQITETESSKPEHQPDAKIDAFKRPSLQAEEADLRQSSGRNTPSEEEKIVSDKSTPLIMGRDTSVKSTLQEFEVEPCGNSASVTLIKDDSGKSTPYELEKPKDLSGKSTPQDMERDISGKSTPLERELNASGKNTPQDFKKEDSGKSTPKDLENKISVESLSQNIGSEILGRSTPESKTTEKEVYKESEIHDLENGFVGKTIPQDSRKDLPDEPTVQELKDGIQEKSLTKNREKDILREPTSPNLTAEITGKTTPSELYESVSGRSTPKILEEKISGRSTPKDTGNEVFGKLSPEIYEKQISGKSTPQNLVIEVSGKSTPQDLEISEKSTLKDLGKNISRESIPQDVEKEIEASVIKKSEKEISREPSPIDALKDISGKSTPLMKDVSGKNSPQDVLKDTSGKSTPQDFRKDFNGKFVQHDSDKTREFASPDLPDKPCSPLNLRQDISEKSSFQEVEKIIPEKEIFQSPNEVVSPRSTPKKHEISAQELGEQILRMSEITPECLKRNGSGKTSPRQEEITEIDGFAQVIGSPGTKSPRDSSELSHSDREKNLSGKTTPFDVEKPVSEKTAPRDFDSSRTSPVSSEKATSLEDEKGVSGKSSRRESIIGSSNKGSPVPASPRMSQELDPLETTIQSSVQNKDSEELEKAREDLTKDKTSKEEKIEDEKDKFERISSQEVIKPVSGKISPIENAALSKEYSEKQEEKAVPVEKVGKRMQGTESSVSDSVSPGPGEKDVSGKSTPFSTDKEISGKVSPVVGEKMTSDSFSLALAEKGTSGTYSLEKEISEKISSPSPVDISPLSLDELKEDGKEKRDKEKDVHESSKSPVQKESKKSVSETHIPGKSQLERVKYEEGGSSGTSTPDRSNYEKSDTSLPNGVESEDEPEKGILESERQEKESQILDISSGEEEELKALGDDEDSDAEIRKDDLERGIILATEIAKGEKDDINKLVKIGAGLETEEEQITDYDNKTGVKRMLVTASSEDGGTETEICIKSGVKVEKEKVTDEEEVEKEDITDEQVEQGEGTVEGEFSNLILQARKEYNAQRSRKISYNSSEEIEEAEDSEKVEEEEDPEEELGTLLKQARQELAFVQSKNREMVENESIKSERKYKTKKTTTSSETTRTDFDDIITITTTLTEEREEQEDGSIKVTTTKETTTKGGENEGTIVTVSTNIERKECGKLDDEESSSQKNFSGDQPAEIAVSKGEGEEKTSQEEVMETSRRTSASSVISQEDLVSRKDSAKIEDFRQSSTEMSPLKTTYITSHGDSESLMTSSFYGNLPTEDEMIGRAEHLREFRRGKGYESFTEVGPNGERTERTYFYGSDDDPRGRERSRCVKAYYTEAGQQKDGEQSRVVHRYYTSDIPEKEAVEKTRFVQRFYAEGIHPESREDFKFVETLSEEPTEHMDFAKAIDEHISARGEYLGKEFQKDMAKFTNGKSKGDAEGETTNSESKDEEKKDLLEGWGKPLGLPLPPKNMNKIYAFPGQNISTTSTLSTPTDNSDSVSNWGYPLNLPSPAPPPTVNGTVETLPGKTANAAKETPKKEKKIQPKKNVSGDKSSGTNTPNRRSESPVKQVERRTPSVGRSNKSAPNSYVYLDLTYVPHHGNSYYSNVEFFKKVRARYYVFSGTEPSKEVYNALLEAKQTWEDKKLEVTIIPTYDTDVLGYWVAENEEILAKHKIDLSPSASRCTINLQDHETSCSAYRLEF